MPTGHTFRQLVRQVRAGDEQAATTLVREYGPVMQRFIRVRLNDPMLRRIADSADICQSVLANFFVRLRAGQFDLDNPKQLLKLLSTMAQNKLTDMARKQHAACRDVHRLAPGNPDEAMAEVVDEQASPSSVVAARELWQKVRSRLADEERYLAEQRALGKEWSEIARELGDSPDALRMKLTRVLNRLASQLGLDEVHHD